MAVPQLCAAATRGRGKLVAPPGSQTPYCPSLHRLPASPSSSSANTSFFGYCLIFSLSFSPQQSITTTPEVRRSCRCRSGTRCTSWRRMKVRAAFQPTTSATGADGASSSGSTVLLTDENADLFPLIRLAKSQKRKPVFLSFPMSW